LNKLGTILIFFLAPFGVNASGIDLALSNETAYLSFFFDSDPLYAGQVRTRDGGSELAIGAFISEDDDHLLHANLLARGYKAANASVYQISAGMKLLGGDIEVDEDIAPNQESQSVGALALGFQAGLVLIPSTYNPVELSFEGYYAPSITSFSDAERYTEISARLQIDITTRARAYVGYRRMEFDTEGFEDITIDRSAHFGLVLLF
jgi:hypothetical protein